MIPTYVRSFEAFVTRRDVFDCVCRYRPYIPIGYGYDVEVVLATAPTVVGTYTDLGLSR